LEEGGCDGGRWRLLIMMELWLTGESLRNEGTGFDGRGEGSLERQD